MILKSGFTATFLTSLLIALPSSASARTNWQGEVMITKATSACASDGWAVGNHGLVTFLPANLDNNGSKSYLAFHFNRRNAYSYAVNGSLLPGRVYAAVGITSAGSSFSFAGSFSLYSQSPANLTAATSFVNISGQIINFSGMSGCTVDFEAGFVRRR